jgi:hypothetical protein
MSRTSIFLENGIDSFSNDLGQMKNVINSYFKSSVSLWIKLDYFENCEFTGACIKKKILKSVGRGGCQNKCGAHAGHIVVGDAGIYARKIAGRYEIWA